MKSIRGFALGLALGVAAAVATVGLAQSTKPANEAQTQTQKAESCCAMTSGSQGDSCAMHGDAKEHAQGQMKAHTGEGCCCCCSGDSCDMEMKTKMKAKQGQG